MKNLKNEEINKLGIEYLGQENFEKLKSFFDEIYRSLFFYDFCVFASKRSFCLNKIFLLNKEIEEKEKLIFKDDLNKVVKKFYLEKK